MNNMTRSFTTLAEAYGFRYDLKKQGIRSHCGVDVNGVYTVSYTSARYGSVSQMFEGIIQDFWSMPDPYRRKSIHGDITLEGQHK